MTYQNALKGVNPKTKTSLKSDIIGTIEREIGSRKNTVTTPTGSNQSRISCRDTDGKNA